MGALIDGLLGGDDKERATALGRVHPLYTSYQGLWNVGLDAYDGTGGFLDGAYLWRFPRESDDAWVARRTQARYHNYSQTLADVYLRHVVTSVQRESPDADLEAWWTNVDGRGEPINAYVQSVLGPALAAGHAGTLTDMGSVEPTGPAVADNPNIPFLVTYQATAILDWRVDRQGLAAVKLAEAPPTVGLDEDPAKQTHGFLVWDRESWARFTPKGQIVGTGDHNLGVVPFDMLRPVPSRRHPFIGKALVSPAVVRALYNRASEEDVVLRDQAFSMFVVSIPSDATDDQVQKVRDSVGTTAGTSTVTVIKGQADFKTPDMAVPGTIRENQAHLIHELYRAAHLRFQRDSLQESSGEAIRLQRQDLNQTLASLAQAVRTFELQLVRRYYAWRFPGTEVDNRVNAVTIAYPGKDDFDFADIETELRAAAQSIALQLGPTATARIKERVVQMQLPDLDAETLETVREEIEAIATAPADRATQIREDARQRLQAANITAVA